MEEKHKIFRSDIDIDIADREKLLALIRHTPATIRNKSTNRKHNSGIYVTDIPYDPMTASCALHYEDAENRGYLKLDILNMSIYHDVVDEIHLNNLMSEPDWTLLTNKNAVEVLIHLNRHYDAIRQMPEPINSIPKLAMMLAVIRPAKRHLIGLPWNEVEKTIWQAEEGEYVFKKSHSFAYGHLVVVAMNLLKERHEKTGSYSPPPRQVLENSFYQRD